MTHNYLLCCLVDVRCNLSILFSFIGQYIYHCMSNWIGALRGDYQVVALVCFDIGCFLSSCQMWISEITKNSKKIPWVPNIGPKIRKISTKANKEITFTSDKNLQSILCQNKPKLLPNSHPVVHQFNCSCNDKYNG